MSGKKINQRCHIIHNYNRNNMPKQTNNEANTEGGKMVLALQQVNARRKTKKTQTERASKNRKAREDTIAECEQRKDHERRRMVFRTAGNNEDVIEEDNISKDSESESDDDEQEEGGTMETTTVPYNVSKREKGRNGLGAWSSEKQ